MMDNDDKVGKRPSRIESSILKTGREKLKRKTQKVRPTNKSQLELHTVVLRKGEGIEIKDTRDIKSYTNLEFTCLFSLSRFIFVRIRLLVCVSIVLSFARRVGNEKVKKRKEVHLLRH